MKLKLLKHLFIAAGIVTSFLLGYGVTAKAYYGQNPGYGYFTGAGYDQSGWEVLNVSCSGSGEYGPYNYFNGHGNCNSIPRDLNTAGELIAFIEGRLANGIPNGSYGFSTGTYGDPRARTGAASIVHTMLGTPTGQRSRPPNATQMANWRNIVNQYAAAGRINWSTQAYGFTVNSLYQGTDNSPSPNDVTFYDQWRDGAMIVFTAPNGTLYAIRRECGNPMGGASLGQLSNYSTVGYTTVNNATPRPTDTIRFTYFVRNDGPTATGTDIWWVALNSANGAVVGGAANSGQYNAGQTKTVFTENYTVPAGTPAGTQICRQTGWDPVNSGGARDGRGTPVCATVRYDYTLTPSITIRINGGATPGAVAEPGDQVEFIYAVTNSGTTQSRSTNCTIYGLSRTGFYAIPTPHDSTSDPGFVQPAHGCPRTFPWSSTPTATNMVTENIASIPATDANRSICRSLWINPRSATDASAISTEVCVRVAAKPYLRVYGGDVSAGNGQTTTPGSCTNNSAASIIGWNQGAPGGYSAAAVQYAAMALGRIYDVSTSLNNGTGAAPVPSGLAFANTGASGSNFGGLYGSVPCIPNHYNTTATTLLPSTNLNSLSGINRYRATGPVALGGNINPNQRTVVYVDGDVLINSNIVYTGSWTPASVPLLQLVVRGNLYISQNVTQLDGIFIAQPNGATGGNIYTCANPALPAAAVLTTSGTVYTNCRNKLTINGAFVAKQVQFLRTNGSLKQAAAGEASGSTNIAEVFNFTPALWMAQPPTPSGSGGEYDAITSLPPVL
jgi:hypothetical protein